MEHQAAVHRACVTLACPTAGLVAAALAPAQPPDGAGHLSASTGPVEHR